jgi:hypothetical protein
MTPPDRRTDASFVALTSGRFTKVERGPLTGGPQRISLRALRVALGVTQVDVARASGVDQAEISRMEQRSDVKLSTLHRYVKALGGAAEVQVVVNGRKFVLELEAADREPARKARR